MSIAILCPVVAILLVVADQLIKQWAVGALAEGSIPLIEGVLSFTYHENFGAAFGLMQNMQPFLIGATVLIMLGVFVLICMGRIKGWLLTASVTLIVAGGIGNLIDRVINGYVIDYIYFELIDFPIFNFADCCVVVGYIVLVIGVFLEDRNEKKRGSRNG